MSSRSEKPVNSLRKQMHCFLVASVVLACAVAVNPVCAEDSMGNNLSKLEDKYFQHDFSKDEPADRLERLEKLVFGEARSGGNEQRLKTLLDMVPDLNAPKTDDSATQQSSAPAAPSPTPKRTYKAADPLPDKSADNEPIANDSSYPAVTAIEKKLLGRDYIGESVGKRLDRLEIKAFGKTNASDDLQDRVDRLRSATGVDIAKSKPINSEWADEEEDPVAAGSQGVQPFTGIGDDPSQQRNYRKQAQNSYTRPRPYDPYAGTGTFGAGGSNTASSGSSGSFGMGNTASADPSMPPSAPDYSHAGGVAPSAAPQLGVNQKLALLEREVFKKTYDKETILNRLNRLESTVFPQDKPATDRSLPERMGRLLSAVPISPGAATAAADPPPKRKRDPDFPDLDFGPSNMSSVAPPVAPQRGSGGLSKIINGLGNALSGGYSGTYSGSYAATPGTLITDPQTGLLYDQYTGTYIDPMTGAVVSRRATTGYGGMGTMGTMNGYGYPAYGGFNSGFSPTPFGRMGVGGMGSGMGFGFGSGGMRIGF